MEPKDRYHNAALRIELDAYYANLYDLTRDKLCYILDPKVVYGPDFPRRNLPRPQREGGEAIW